jgi:glutaredoxin
VPEVTVYTRQGCHLCEVAQAQLRKIARDRPMTVRLVDVDSDPALRALYGARVPVVMIEDRVLDEGAVTEYRLRKALS